jgi:segregation and condensation protein A
MVLLDVLLDLAKAQKVNLEEISITKLADQFHNYISNKKDLKFRSSFGISFDGNLVSLFKIKIIITRYT